MDEEFAPRADIDDPDTIFDDVEDMINRLVDLRDCQTVIPEPEDNTQYYVYNMFDEALDKLREIHREFVNHFKEKVEDLEATLAEDDLDHHVRQGTLEILTRIEDHAKRECP